MKNKKILKGKDIFFEVMLAKKSGTHDLSKRAKNKKERRKIKLELRKFY